MSSSLPSPRPRPRRFVARALLVLGAVGVFLGVRELRKPERPTLKGLVTASAQRVDLRSTLRAPGRTESANSTTIECQLERLEMRSEGRSTMSGGASTILWVIDEGTWVKKDDVLCTLDSSEYEELVRQQEIKVDRAKADLQQARLEFESAQMGVAEFREGLIAQTLQDYEGQLRLAQSDRQRAEDRLRWSTRMLEKGYVSGDQVASDRQAVRRADLAITKATWALKNFQTYGAPMETRSLEAQVASAKSQFIYVQLRCSRFIERLDHYKKMVDLCTIRAPHDAFVIYANQKSPWRQSSARIEPGAQVRQMQNLFILPDLSRMQVVTSLHESVVNKVHPGMLVKARIEGLANRQLEGHVLKVNPIPDLSDSWATDTKTFNAVVQLDVAPRDIRPDMTAEVEIDLGVRSHVVTIPTEALTFEKGKDVCYVATDEGILERRQIKLGQSNRDLLEVTEGVEEGEHVVVDLSHLAEYDPLIVDGRPHLAPDHHDAGAPSVASTTPPATPTSAGL